MERYTTESGNPAPLLTRQERNPKTAAGEPLPYHSAILHLAPFNLSGYMTCSHASGSLADGTGCVSACLNTAGHGGIGGPDNSVQRARIRKTRFHFEHRAAFMAQLVLELESLIHAARTRGKRPACRLNGTSDLGWHKERPCTRAGVTYPHIFAAFPEIQFYDYTKVPGRLGSTRDITNYALTFSLSEDNDVHALHALAMGHNVAVVLRVGKHEAMPERWSGIPVVDGTTHDFRFLDPKGGHIIGLKPKGPALTDTSGFVHDLDAVLDGSRVPTLAARSLSRRTQAA